MICSAWLRLSGFPSQYLHISMGKTRSTSSCRYEEVCYVLYLMELKMHCEHNLATQLGLRILDVRKFFQTLRHSRVWPLQNSARWYFFLFIVGFFWDLGLNVWNLWIHQLCLICQTNASVTGLLNKLCFRDKNGHLILVKQTVPCTLHST